MKNEFDIFEVFFDGQCPLCRREIELLRKWDRDDRIRFCDFTQPEFDFAGLGIDYETLMKEIHGRHADGQIVVGADVFRQLYQRVGFARWVRFSQIWPLNHLIDFSYRCFARLRKFAYRNRCHSASCSIPASPPGEPSK